MEDNRVLLYSSKHIWLPLLRAEGIIERNFFLTIRKTGWFLVSK